MVPAPAIVLGIAAVRRKLYSTPMQGIVSALRTSNPSFTIVLLDEYQMESEPVSHWPVVHVLLTMYNPEFPLEKVLAYCDLRRPVLVNNLHMQGHMMDRREIRHVLERAGVPTPHAVFVDRDAGDVVEQTGPDGDTLVVRNAKRKREFAICKPFVEKPVDPDDHSMLPWPAFSFRSCASPPHKAKTLRLLVSLGALLRPPIVLRFRVSYFAFCVIILSFFVCVFFLLSL